MKLPPGSRRALPVLLLASLAAAGCGVSPEPAYYALAPSRGPTRGGSPGLIEVRRPTIAGYLDRAAMVLRVAGYRVDIARGQRWGEPLDGMIGRVLAEDLGDRLPDSSVVAAEAAASAADADAVVDVDLQRFDAGAGGAVILRAEVTIEGGRGQRTQASRPVLLSTYPVGWGIPALVEALSVLLGRLADVIAGMLTAR